MAWGMHRFVDGTEVPLLTPEGGTQCPGSRCLRGRVTGVLLSVVGLVFLVDRERSGTVFLTGVGGSVTGGLVGHYLAVAMDPVGGYSVTALVGAVIGGIVFLMVGLAGAASPGRRHGLSFPSGG